MLDLEFCQIVTQHQPTRLGKLQSRAGANISNDELVCFVFFLKEEKNIKHKTYIKLTSFISKPIQLPSSSKWNLVFKRSSSSTVKLLLLLPFVSFPPKRDSSWDEVKTYVRYKLKHNFDLLPNKVRYKLKHNFDLLLNKGAYLCKFARIKYQLMCIEIRQIIFGLIQNIQKWNPSID